MSKKFRLTLPALMLILALVWPAKVVRGQDHWVTSWTAAPQLLEGARSAPAADTFDSTLRQVVHLTAGGTSLRLRVSNRYGKTPLVLDDVSVARAVRAGSARVVASSAKAITFSGRMEITIPQGADYLSDPVEFPTAAQSDLAISFHFERLPDEQTGHADSIATSFLMRGAAVRAEDLPESRKLEHWYFIDGLDVLAIANAAAIVVMGDSITDSYGSTIDGNNRWPDVLAKRLQARPETSALAVLNQGIGGNRLLADNVGSNALARFDHDVLAHAGVHFLIVLEGINDLGNLTREKEASPSEHESFVRRLLGAYEQIIARAHAHGITVIGGTLTPFLGSSYYHPNALNEADRQAVNRWIRTAGHFDGLIDFDKAVRDPEKPDQLSAAFDQGDHIHLSPAGYAAMGNAVLLVLFSRTVADAGN